MSIYDNIIDLNNYIYKIFIYGYKILSDKTISN